MNKAKIIEVMEDGATFDSAEGKLIHSSFRKGFRKMKLSDISWIAVERAHGLFGTKRLVKENQTYRLI